ncbi:renalase isoform X2 [Hyalella azteca]|nr:renalase isoform X2 [Hyalella azteca]XP_018021163.1 renalase isoform X2 [Hyalella azteca]XP_047739023.1 renalase isoform X2 [Hyalella azteca]
MRVCIVGGGLTGAIAASLLRSSLPALHIELWDKASRFGGRMCTKRKPSEPRVSGVDVGAQYISSTPEYYAAHKSYYSDLVARGVLQPMTCRITDDRHPPDTRHFVAPNGMSSVVQHFVDKAACTARLGTQVRDLQYEWDKCEGKSRWRVAAADGEVVLFDAVLLTLPVPQMLALGGDLTAAIDKVAGLRSELEAVSYSSRFCLGLFYPASVADQIILPEGVAAMYITNSDSPFCYVAIDNLRRGLAAGDDGFLSVMVHTSRAFGAARVEEQKEALLPELLDSFRRLFPSWPAPCDAFCHKWRYSQVVTPVPESRGGSVAVGGGEVVLSGDAFTHSNVDGCIRAATSAAAALTQYVAGLKTADK